MPSRSRRSRNRFRMALCTETSSAEVISSAISTSGRTASARASATRCRCPPESRPGSSRTTAGSRWTSSSSSSTSLARTGTRRAPPAAAASAIAAPTVMRGLSEETGPGRPSAPAASARRRSRCAGAAPRLRRATPPRRRSGRARRSPWRGWTCPSRTPRPDRRSTAPAGRGRRRSTATSAECPRPKRTVRPRVSSAVTRVRLPARTRRARRTFVRHDRVRVPAGDPVTALQRLQLRKLVAAAIRRRAGSGVRTGNRANGRTGRPLARESRPTAAPGRTPSSGTDASRAAV